MIDMEIRPEDYYDILMENLADIGEMPQNATPEQIAMFVDSIKPHVDLIPHAMGNLHLYRARYVDLKNPFDTSDPEQYGYIHNGYIKMFRYNRENEAVLYTATDPAIAFREIESPKQGNRYYLSVWRKKTKNKLNGAFIISSRYKKGSNAEKFHKELVKIYDEFKVQYFNGLGYLLENPEGNYELSSQIAHKLFSNGADMLVTTSMKSDEKEMNFTFRRDVADNYLEMTTVYECELTASRNPSIPNIHKIGVLTNGKVIWHNWRVIPESVQLLEPQPQNRKIVVSEDELLKAENLSQIRPNPMWNYDEVHTSYMHIEGIPVFVKFKIELT